MDHATHQCMKFFINIYIYIYIYIHLKNFNISIQFAFRNIHLPKQTMPIFYVNKTKFKLQETVNKCEKKIFNWVTLSQASSQG